MKVSFRRVYGVKRLKSLAWKASRLLLGFLIFTIVIPAIASSPASGPRLVLAPDDRISDQVTVLLMRLDSKEYSQREQAARELIEIGEKAILPLAMKSFDCSPESCWRIRKILEQISTRGSEIVFYKTTGILQLRFDSSSSKMKQRLTALESKWKAERKKKAISLLREKGALVDDPLEGQTAPARPWFADEVFFGAVPPTVVINGRVVEISNGQTEPTQLNAKRSPRKQLSETEVKKEIQRILGSDLNQARKIAFGGEEKPDSGDQPNNSFIEVHRGMPVRGDFFGAPTAASTGVTLELGDRFKGNAEDLKALADIVKLSEVKLINQKIDAAILKHICASSINKLAIENCEVTTVEIEKAKWPKSLREIEFAKLELSNEFLAKFAGTPSVNLVTFRQCELELNSDFEAFKQMKSLRGLEFDGFDMSGKMFESFADLKQLSFINLSYCKFKTQDYKALQKKRPNLQISYTAKAFLGVRGPMDLAGGGPAVVGCVVSEVIAGSGAEKGGMKADDIIETINGEKVEVFEDLKLHIAQHRPGEKLMVTVRRSGRPVELEIELSSFDEIQP